MHLKVGELARRSGLTVRTLHHYDSIGLLRPSARSDKGYRLYDQADMARLHGIQALRRIGLPLDEISTVLDADAADLSRVVARQIRALDREIEQAGALRDRLLLAQAKFAAGGEPDAAEWLDTLQLMNACGAYFSPAEIKLIFGNWSRLEPEWVQLVEDLQVLMDAGVPPLDPRVQPLARRWSSLMHSWMAGDFDLMRRWGEMYLAEPGVHGRARPGLAMVRYIEPAVQLRLSLVLRHLSVDDLHRLSPVPEAEWLALTAEVQALIDVEAPLRSGPVRKAVARWRSLVKRATRGDDALAARLGAAHAQEPLLRDTAALSAAARDFLARAAAAQAIGRPRRA